MTVEVITATFDVKQLGTPSDAAAATPSTPSTLESSDQMVEVDLNEMSDVCAATPAPTSRQRLGIELGEYGVVVSVVPGLLGSRCNTLRPGDRVVEVNGVPCSEVPADAAIRAASGEVVIIAHRRAAARSVRPAFDCAVRKWG